jgi:hypothetical protein
MAEAVEMIVKARRIHVMDAARSVRRAIAIRGEWIVAASAESDGLDGLRGGAHTRVIDARAPHLVPAIFDTHEHLLESARDLALVQADKARSVSNLCGLIRARAAQTAAGQWIVTSMSWDETKLAERRLSTATELDSATNAHPVLCPRGGHICEANWVALALAHLGADTVGPPGGTIVPDGASIPTGILKGGAAHAIRQLVPATPTDQMVGELGVACDAYAAVGVGSVREGLLEPGELGIYRRARARDVLKLRCRPTLNVDPRWPRERRLTYIEDQIAERERGDDWLRVWGLKLVLDGGVPGSGNASIVRG